MSMSDRRRNPRFPTCSHADLRLGLTWLSGSVVDLSLKGALFESETASAGLRGKACRLHITNVVEPINGLIVHSEEGLLGIKFIGINQKVHDDLIYVIASSQAAPSHSYLEREVPALLKA